MHRLERLINLVAALLHTERPLTADELQVRVPGYPEAKPTFRRAFERDKDALREMGVPISVEFVHLTNPGVEGYRIRKDAYYLRDPELAPDELAALHLAASAVKLEGADGMEALWKLGGQVAENGPAPATAALPGAANLGAVFSAISTRRPVSFTYRGRRRQVDPYRLSFRSGHWYLGGRDRDVDEERSYRLDRIDSDVVPAGEEGAFDRRPVTGPQPPPWEMGTDDPLDAVLLVDAGQAGWAVGQLGEPAVRERRADGSVVLAVRVTNRDAFRSFVLGFLHHAEVLDPPELRAETVAWLEAFVAGSP